MTSTLDLNGGSGGPTGGGGGTPGTGTGTAIGSALPVGEYGGVLAATWFLFQPVQNTSTGISYIGFYDMDSFDDPNDGSSYSYRVEDISPDKVPTVNRVILTYRDLGLATITATLTGVNDDGKIVSISVNSQIGNKIPTNALLTEFIDIELSAFRPQLTLSRAAGGGPIDIVAVTMRGEVEP